jgi:hypothetical protein
MGYLEPLKKHLSSFKNSETRFLDQQIFVDQKARKVLQSAQEFALHFATIANYFIFVLLRLSDKHEKIYL